MGRSVFHGIRISINHNRRWKYFFFYNYVFLLLGLRTLFIRIMLYFSMYCTMLLVSHHWHNPKCICPNLSVDSESSDVDWELTELLGCSIDDFFFLMMQDPVHFPFLFYFQYTYIFFSKNDKINWLMTSLGFVGLFTASENVGSRNTHGFTCTCSCVCSTDQPFLYGTALVNLSYHFLSIRKRLNN